jgi:ferredoxin
VAPPVTPRASRLRVNPILCDGVGYCAELVPELISFDEWGYPIIDSRPIESSHALRLARRAVAACPKVALFLDEVQPPGQ